MSITADVVAENIVTGDSDRVPTTADDLAGNIAVMSDTDHVRGAGELICVKSRPTLSNCPSGLATTGYTTRGL